MAKSPFFIFNSLRPNPKPYFLSPFQCFTTGSEPGNLTEVAGAICGIIRTRPRWEDTLISTFPSVNFSNPAILNEVLKLQNNVFLNVRLFHWLSSQSGFSPDPLVCKSLFDSLVEAKASVLAKSFIDAVPQFSMDPRSLESLIRVLCEDGYVDEALDLFHKLKSSGVCPSLGTWNSALAGSVRAKRTDVVWKLYGEMMDRGVTSDVETVGHLIQAFCIDNNVERGYELLCQIRDGGGIPGNVALNKLMSVLSKEGNFYRVSELLHLMIATNNNPDIYTYQEVINGLCKRKKVVEAYRIFNDLKTRGYAPDRVMYTTMINGLCRMRLLGKARKLWFEMMKKGMLPNEYTYNALIYGCCKMHLLEDAWKLHKEMSNKGCNLNTISYNILIAGLCKNRMASEACDLFEEMSRNGIIRDTITYNSLIRGLCSEGDLAKARILFEELVASGLQPSTSSYTPLIEHFCQVGSTQQALELWMDMVSKGVEPSIYNHECIIAGLCKDGSSVEGMQWLSEMLERKLIPRRMTFVSLIRCLLQQDKLDAAFLVVNSMLLTGYALGKSLCCSLLKDAEKLQLFVSCSCYYLPLPQREECHRLM
ncbi:hypothetical protein Cgig2_018671 [Carnegiea gigantea]|uniref:Pentatricopeptide repeat-containing protein n=1 Tax=Carnegiea gigantea TaxID=171969 RepID=A0A9Q1KF69_9CARY|nr:hypothetical protein Cgig2_018671 [Carnegiea gigantea]